MKSYIQLFHTYIMQMYVYSLIHMRFTCTADRGGQILLSTVNTSNVDCMIVSLQWHHFISYRAILNYSNWKETDRPSSQSNYFLMLYWRWSCFKVACVKYSPRFKRYNHYRELESSLLSAYTSNRPQHYWRSTFYRLIWSWLIPSVVVQ